LSAGLVDACDRSDLFGVQLTPEQRALLAAVEAGCLLHVWALGRRSGKTLMGALIAIWMCLLRPELAEHVRRRERRYAVCVATNIRQARIFVEAARSVVEASPLLAPLVESVSDDEIVFKNRTVLAAFPCTSRGGRGWPLMVLLMDECAHMLDTDGNQAAEPIYRSLAPSVAQFGDAARILVASTPYGTDGFFADLFEIVEKRELEDATCRQASTLQMRPTFATAALALELGLKHNREYAKDPPPPARWRITCIFVDKRHRGQGVARAGLEGALAQIATAGGGLVEAISEVTAGREAQSRFLFSATVELFEQNGFARGRQVGKHAWIVSRDVDPT
jgi:GNAT superfamily N-acetyltransferase